MTKTLKDGFVYLLVTDKAKEIYRSRIFELYALHDDDTEFLITSRVQLNEALEHGLEIGIGLGYEEGIKQNKQDEKIN
jgi:hypothetical protein